MKEQNCSSALLEFYLWKHDSKNRSKQLIQLNLSIIIINYDSICVIV